LRDKAIPVTTLCVNLAASKLFDAFKQKSQSAKSHIFRIKMGYSHCTPTHVAQKLYKKTAFYELLS
jgi:hypothetical protein